MSLIIAGRFDTFPQAEAAASQLFSRGFAEDDVTLFFVNPPGQHGSFPIGGDVAADHGARKSGGGAGRGIVIGAIGGAVIGAVVVAMMQASVLVLALATGLGAYLGSLVGALAMTRDPDRVPATPSNREPVKTERDAGVLLAVHVDPQTRDVAAEVLRAAGAKDLERAHGRWSEGRWVDFDPLTPPVPASRP
ncbi:hypothetical protein [Paracidovorax citrulli]